MVRISDEKFISTEYEPDKIVGLRVKNGEFYFLAWMESAPHYRIQQAMNSDGYLLDRDSLIFNGDIFSCVQATDQYNNMYLLYEIDDNGQPVNEDDKDFVNAHDKFLSLVNCYERNGVSDTNDHDIFVLTKEELRSLCDALRDGDYVFITKSVKPLPLGMGI